VKKENNGFTTWEKAVLWLKEQPECLELVRSCYYDDPLSESASRFYNSTEWSAVREELSFKPKGTALDLGAGRGISSYALARDGWKVTALEPDTSEIVGTGAIRALCAQAGLKIEIVEAFAEKLPFADCAFDLVYVRQALHHAADLEKFCREVFRILKNDGIFIATREHVISCKKDLKAFLEGHPLHKYYGGENAYTLGEYKSAFSKSGLKVKKILNAYESDINLFPVEIKNLKNKIKTIIKNAVKISPPDFLVNFALYTMGRIDKRPGRLYTFILKK